MMNRKSLILIYLFTGIVSALNATSASAKSTLGAQAGLGQHSSLVTRVFSQSDFGTERGFFFEGGMSWVKRQNPQSTTQVARLDTLVRYHFLFASLGMGPYFARHPDVHTLETGLITSVRFMIPFHLHWAVHFEPRHQLSFTESTYRTMEWMLGLEYLF